MTKPTLSAMTPSPEVIQFTILQDSQTGDIFAGTQFSTGKPVNIRLSQLPGNPVLIAFARLVQQLDDCHREGLASLSLTNPIDAEFAIALWEKTGRNPDVFLTLLRLPEQLAMKKLDHYIVTVADEIKSPDRKAIMQTEQLKACALR